MFYGNQSCFEKSSWKLSPIDVESNDVIGTEGIVTQINFIEIFILKLGVGGGRVRVFFLVWVSVNCLFCVCFVFNNCICYHLKQKLLLGD